MRDCHRHYFWMVNEEHPAPGKEHDALIYGNQSAIRALERTREEYLEHKLEPRWVEVYRYWGSVNFEDDAIFSVFLVTRDTATVICSNSDRKPMTLKRVLKSQILHALSWKK